MTAGARDMSNGEAGGQGGWELVVLYAYFPIKLKLL